MSDCYRALARYAPREGVAAALAAVVPERGARGGAAVKNSALTAKLAFSSRRLKPPSEKALYQQS